jgi:hypothetical protein
VRPAQDLEAFSELGIGCHRAVQVPVCAHQVGEHFGVAGVGLATGHPVAVAIAVHGLGIDGEDLIAGSHESTDEQSSVRLRADDDLGWVVDELDDE